MMVLGGKARVAERTGKLSPATIRRKLKKFMLRESRSIYVIVRVAAIEANSPDEKHIFHKRDVD